MCKKRMFWRKTRFLAFFLFTGSLTFADDCQLVSRLDMILGNYCCIKGGKTALTCKEDTKKNCKIRDTAGTIHICAYGSSDLGPLKAEVGEISKRIEELHQGLGHQSKCPKPARKEVFELENRLENVPRNEAVTYYQNFSAHLRESITRAKKDSAKEKEMADLAAQKKNLEEVLEHSKKEMEFYPVVQFNGVKFRMMESIDVDIPEEPRDEYYFQMRHMLRGLGELEHDKDSVYLYKLVRKSQLSDIQKAGLNSKFGGINGASVGVQSEELMKKDRGKMYFSADLQGAKAYARHLGKETDLLLVKLPHSETISSNLTANFQWGADWFTVGIIPPEQIYVLSPPSLHKDSSLSTPLTHKNGQGFLPLKEVNSSHSGDGK